ncbi:MAG: hypothetical protein R2705_24700 [Ilumatobacteraceae bacterium]
MGIQVSAAAIESLDGIDVACLVIDGTMGFGSGDRWVAERLPDGFVVVVNKIDRMKPEQVLGQRSRRLRRFRAERRSSSVSAKTSRIDAFIDHLVARMPEGPQYYPDDMVSDLPEGSGWPNWSGSSFLAVTHDRLPYSIAPG